MKKLIIIVVALLLLLGAGGGAGWWFFLREEPDEAVVVEEHSRPVRVFVDFDPLVISVIRDGQVIQHLTFTIIVEFKSQDGRRTAFLDSLRLKDAYRSELHALYSRRTMQQREDAIPIVSKRLARVTERVTGRGTVDRVLVNILSKRELEISEES